MKVLVIEDDAETRDYIARGLREEGHLVEAVSDGKAGVFRAADVPFDLLIVDRMLPGIDGLAAVKSLRAMGVATPVLFLTAMGAIADRVAGLDAGGDDYLVKPFSFAELKARAAALARRPPLREAEESILRVGDLELDRLRRSVQRGATTIELQPREFQLLEFLMLNAGRVVTRTMLLEHVWDFHFDPRTNIVETHISRIRAKVDKDSEQPLIHTVRGAGYVIRAK
jgi:two-component system, OmpR family, response regulator